MKIVSPLPHKRGRLEIIPLIDIMFFLLAAFMMVSIGKIHIKSLKVNLPTDVPAAQKEAKEDFIALSISADDVVQLDKEIVPTKDALLARLQDLYAKNKDQKFLISADREARHGDVMDVLGRLRSAGFQKIAFTTKSEQAVGAGSPAAASVSTAAATTASAPSTLAPPPDPGAAPAAPTNPAPAPAVPEN
jgi:biopolymer transport protein ExbD